MWPQRFVSEWPSGLGAGASSICLTSAVFSRIGRGSLIGGRGPLNGASAGTGRFGLKKGIPNTWCSSIVHRGGSGGGTVRHYRLPDPLR